MCNRHHQLNFFPFDSPVTTAIAFLLLAFSPLPPTPGKLNPRPQLLSNWPGTMG